MSAIIPQPGNITVILSAELDSRDDSCNLANHQLLRQALANLLAVGDLYSVLECTGAYKGVGERSLAITGPTSRILAIGLQQASKFQQESILAIDHYDHGRLHYANGDQESIGRRQACAPGTCDAWTTVIATGETFTFS